MKRLFSLVLLLSIVPSSASAFCGFYVGGGSGDLFNDATNVVLMRERTRTVLSMQNDYSGPPEDFALVIPVPQVLKKEHVKTLDREVFDRIDALAAPRLVEYWEQDPCAQERDYDFDGEDLEGKLSPESVSIGRRGKYKPPVVRIEAKFNVAEYEIVILSADDSTALDGWLRDKGYNIPKSAEQHLAPYVQQGSYFFVARVNAKKVKFDAGGRAQLSPIRFHYDSGDFTLPIKLGLINSRGTQDLIVHVLAADQRYEVGNYPSVTIPTNFELTESSRAVFGSFYAALFDAVVEQNPGAVVTEYAWQATKCDPCPPGSAGLSLEDIMTLGGDVVSFDSTAAKKITGLRKSKKARPTSTPIPANLVLTRLHARYESDSIGQDLVFKKATPIVGGRPTDVEYFSTIDSYNQFQGRYIIRHAWTGPMSCANPVRGVWGYPTSDNVMVAQRTAYIEEREFKIESVTKNDVKMRPAR